MVYDFFVNAGHEEKINLSVAECLYAGVVADTGSFRFSSTHASVHRMVAHLKDVGLDHTRVHDGLYDNFLENRLRFLGYVLSHKLEVDYELNTALMWVSKQELLKFDIKTGDTEGLVNYPLSIQGIRLVGLVIDRDEERKWSFRSKGAFDCNTFARKYSMAVVILMQPAAVIMTRCRKPSKSLNTLFRKIANNYIKEKTK